MPSQSFQTATRRFQAQLVARTLDDTGWSVVETARRLEVTRSHVYNLIRAHGLERAATEAAQFMSARNIDEVIDSLDSIVALSREKADRVGYFAALYRKVTVAVREGIRRGEFLDGDRMDRLDTRFANRYIDALAAYREGKQVSESWRISLDACRDEEPTILQHLYSGLSAHLLLDLAVAAAETAPGARIADIRGDFEHINQIVGRLMREVDGVVGKVSPWIGAHRPHGGRPVRGGQQNRHLGRPRSRVAVGGRARAARRARAVLGHRDASIGAPRSWRARSRSRPPAYGSSRVSFVRARATMSRS